MLIGITPWQRPGETGAKAHFHLFVWRQIKDLWSTFPGHLRANARKKQAKKQKQMRILILACFCVALISSIIRISRHFIVVKDCFAPREAYDEYAPFYGNKMGHFITYGRRQIDEIR